MSRRGFTLVEVLIVVAMSGGLMVAVLANLDASRRAVDAIHNVMETESNGPRILDQIRSDLAHLAVYDAAEYRILKGENAAILGADADRLDLLVSGRSRLGVNVPGVGDGLHPPLTEVGYRLRTNPDRPDFLELYRREDALVDDDPWRDGNYAMMYDRVVSFNLRYAGKPDHNLSWDENWDSAQREALPFGMELFLEIEVQPRRSLESLGIIGANRARLDFNDLMLIPSHQRWIFRNRLHPTLPAIGNTSNATGAGAGGDPASAAGTGGELPEPPR